MIGGQRIFDEQNIGSYKLATDSVFILFKKTDFNTILGCLGGKFFVAEIGGSQFY